MRLTPIASYYSYYFAAVLVGVLPTVVFGYTVSGDGCFERDSSIIRVTEPTCSLTLTSTETEIVELNFANVDPDSVEMTSTDLDLTTERTSTSLETTFLLTGTGTLTIAPWLEVDDDNLWFVALSDNQAAGTVETNPIFEDMLPMISAINPVFMTNAGDLIQGSGDDDTAHDMFTAVLETLEETTIPMYPTPGNHDYNSDLGIYESYFGQADYSYDYGPAHLVALSSSGTSSRGTVTNDQRDWLSAELANTTLQTIVYFHHPLSVPSWGKSTCCFEDSTERDSLAAALEAGGVDHVINGHSQGYDWRWLTASDVTSLQDGLYQLISGGGGGNIAQPDGDYHFTLVHVTPDAITHQVFDLEDTDIVVDENKAGDEVTVEYNGVADLPYFRLKFKLDDYTPQYLIANEAGEYLSYSRHDFENYTVLFSETSVARGTTTFTALPANTIHTGISQTVDTTGYITFATAPTSLATNTAMTVLPNKLTTTISAVTATVDGYTWLEQPTSRSINTTYALGDLPAEADMRVYVNDELFTRGRSDTAGAFSFTYTPNKTERNFSVIVQSELTDIITVPTDSGTAHVRTFSLSGKNTGNFFSANQRIGLFRLGYSYITNEREPALLVTERETGRLFLHSGDGEKLDTISISNKVSSTANRLMVDQGNGIRTYRWSSKKQQLQAVDRWQLPWPLVDWTLIDNDIVAVIKRSTAQRSPRYVLMTTQQTKRLPRNITDVHILGCRCQTTTAAVIIVSWKKNDRRYITSYSSDLVKLSHKMIKLSGDSEQWIAGRLTDRILDTVIMVSDGTAYPLQARASGKLKRLPNVAGVDQVGIVGNQLVVTTSVRPSYVEVYEYNNLLDDFELDESFYPYGETFPGGVTLALP